MMMGECRPMSARISPRQCAINRERDLYLCGKCGGLENVKEQIFEEVVMPKKEEGAGRRGKHLLCTVPGCEKIRVRDGMCMAHFREAQRTSGNAAVPAPSFAPCEPSVTLGATSTPIPVDDIYESMNESRVPEAISTLLPPPEPSPPPRKGVFIDLTDFPDLDAWLHDMCAISDIPIAIIGLLEARRKGLLLPKVA
jgi:hypothetical protein